jgi:predicted CoA-binding protein
MTYSDDLLRRVLTRTHTIVLVGASANPLRPSHGVMRFLLSKGYRVIPVNPGLAGQTLMGQTVHARLADIPDDADMIDIFRQSDMVPGIVAEALTRWPNLQTIWMQLGVQHDAAAKAAEARGVTVIQNRCPAIEFPRLFGQLSLAGVRAAG